MINHNPIFISMHSVHFVNWYVLSGCEEI